MGSLQVALSCIEAKSLNVVMNLIHAPLLIPGVFVQLSAYYSQLRIFVYSLLLLL